MYQSLGELECRLLGPTPKVSDLVSPGKNLRVCTSSKFPGAAGVSDIYCRELTYFSHASGMVLFVYKHWDIFMFFPSVMLLTFGCVPLLLEIVLFSSH